MDKYPYEVKQKLKDILEQTDKIAWLFSKNPTKDFSRHRKFHIAGDMHFRAWVSGSNYTGNPVPYSLCCYNKAR